MKKVVILALILMTSLTYGADRSIALAGKNSESHKRVALVIGNGKYQYTDFLPKLANPPHDAEDIAAALRSFGFEVIQKNNLTKEEMDTAISDFGRKIGNSEAALFYFAGHGLQVKGQNYIVPVDAKIDSEAQVEYKSININQLLTEMEISKSHVNIVMLDACRNNPISGKFRSGATRGLAPTTSQAKGTIIVYATEPGNVAADGSGRNGLFTSGLLTAFKGSDLSLLGVLTRASDEVERGSGKKQIPYINGPLTLQKNFQFLEGKPVRTASLEPSSALAQPEERIKSDAIIEQETWESARDSKNSNAIQEYIKQYPSGRFVGQAKVLIATLTPAEPPSPSITSRIGNLFGSSSKGSNKEINRRNANDLLEKGIALYKTSSFQESIKLFNEAIKLDPQLDSAYTERGYSNAKLNNYDRAISDYSTAIKLNPKVAINFQNRAQAFSSKGKFTLALKDFKTVLALNDSAVPLSDTYREMGVIFYRQGKFNEAIKYWQLGLSKSPKDAGLYNNLAIVYKTLGKYDEAMAAVKSAIAIEPQMPELLNTMGELYMEKQDYTNAIKCFSSALEHDLNMPLGYWNLALALYNAEKFYDALSNAKRYASMETDVANKTKANKLIKEIEKNLH